MPVRQVTWVQQYVDCVYATLRKEPKNKGKVGVAAVAAKLDGRPHIPPLSETADLAPSKEGGAALIDTAGMASQRASVAGTVCPRPAVLMHSCMPSLIAWKPTSCLTGACAPAGRQQHAVRGRVHTTAGHPLAVYIDTKECCCRMRRRAGRTHGPRGPSPRVRALWVRATRREGARLLMMPPTPLATPLLGQGKDGMGETWTRLRLPQPSQVSTLRWPPF